MTLHLQSTSKHADSKVPVTLINHLLDHAASFGIIKEELMHQAGLTPAHLSDPNQCIPLSHLEQLTGYAYQASNDPLIHLKALQYINPTVYGVLGHLMPLSGTLGSAIELMIRYQQLIGRIGIISLRYEPGLAYWTWQCKSNDPLFSRCATEYNLGYWSMLVRLIRDQDSPALLAVHFQHEPPGDVSLIALYEHTFKCPVYFGQPESALILAASALTIPLKTSNAGLSVTVENYARQLVEQSQDQAIATLTEQVRTRVRLLLHQGKASREVVAAQLHMSVRSLSRQLLQEESSYRKILDEVRFELAKVHLRTAQVTVEEIARLLGFQGSHSFINWFRSLTGCTPGNYQKNWMQGLE